jgi:acylphosphatase
LEKIVENKAVRAIIRGRVQGVGYRIWAERTARSLALKGTVRNRIDDSVELVLAGPAEDVSRMLELCRSGPRSARVAQIETSQVDFDGEGFSVLPTT